MDIAPRGEQAPRNYYFGSMRVACDWDIPELFPWVGDPEGKPDVYLELHSDQTNLPKGIPWVSLGSNSPQSGLVKVARIEDQYLVRFEGFDNTTFSVSRDRVLVLGGGDLDRETLNHLILDQILPRALSLRRLNVLHAGGVDLGYGTIAFLGESGAGKSTLTAHFVSTGFELLSDDALVLETRDDYVRAMPTYSSLRLWPDSVAGIYTTTPVLSRMAHYSSKRRVVQRHLESDIRPRAPLLAGFIIGAPTKEEEPRPELVRVSPREACVVLLANTFTLDVFDPKAAANRLDMLGHIVARVPFYRLTYSRDFSILDLVSDSVLALLQHSGRNSFSKPEGD